MIKNHRGFTLIEILVVIAIIGMLAAIAYPAYAKYLIKGNRSAAQGHLVELAQKEQDFLADTRAYKDSVSALNMTTPAGVSKNYTIDIKLEDGPPPRFTITATPIPGTKQAADGALTIDSSGTKSPADKW